MKHPFAVGNRKRLHTSLWLALIFSFAPLASRASVSANLPGEWPMYGNGPAHTGYFPGTLNGLPFVMKWRAPMPNFNVSPPVIGGGRAFVTTGWYLGPMSLRVLDAESGQLLWLNNFASGDAINPPAYTDGAVYVQWTDGLNPSKIFRFDAATGVTNWSATYAAQDHQYFAPVIADGTVYAATGEIEMRGYNRTNGTLRFLNPLIGDSCDEWTPAYYNGKAYSWVNGYFSEHQPLNGVRNWTLTNGTPSEFGYSMNRTVAIADSRAYFTSTTKLMAVDLAAHTNLWQINGQFSGTPAVANGIVYAISNAVVQAYSTNGVFVRTFNPGFENLTSTTGQLIVTDDALLLAGSYGVYIFRLADGSVQQYISSYRQSGGGYYSSRIGLANNTLFISSGDSSLYAFSSSNLWKFTINGNGATNGSPAPDPYGTNYMIGGTLVTNTLPSPIAGPIGTVRYVVTGWTGTGSVPASGSTNTVAFTATADSTLTWNFKTQYYLDTSVDPNGSVDIDNAWFDAGSNVTVTATSAQYYHFVNWSGDISGTANPIVIPMNGPRTVLATFAPNLVTNGVPELWLAQNGLPVSDAGALADSDGDGFANWQEFAAGTNPNDPTSLLQLTQVPPSPGNPQLTLRWPSWSGRIYRLLSTTNLGAAFSPLATNLNANPPFNYYYLDIGNTQQQFFRVQIE
jgi:hypothetical protein